MRKGTSTMMATSFALSALCLSCAAQRSTGDARVARARSVSSHEHACAEGEPAERSASLQSLRGVLDAEPLSTTRQTKLGLETHVEGAALHVAATENLATAYLARQIECHQADVVLGRTEAIEDDPFLLPDQWVGVRVDAVGAVVVVELRPEAGGAEETLDRAKRFATRHGRCAGKEPRCAP